MGIRERWLPGVSTISLVSPVWGVCTCRIHNGLRAPFTQEYVPHSHMPTCPMHTRVRAPFTHAYPPLSHRRTCPIHTSVRKDDIHTGWPSSSEPVPLDPWKLTGKLPQGASESPSPTPPPSTVPLPPRLASRRPAPPLATLALLLHPSLRSPVLPAHRRAHSSL